MREARLAHTPLPECGRIGALTFPSLETLVTYLALMTLKEYHARKGGMTRGSQKNSGLPGWEGVGYFPTIGNQCHHLQYERRDDEVVDFFFDDAESSRKGCERRPVGH